MILPSSELRNHYTEISRHCREEKSPVIITVNGRGDTAVINLNEYYRMKAELELLKNLAEAEEDAATGQVGLMTETFDDIRKALLER